MGGTLSLGTIKWLMPQPRCLIAALRKNLVLGSPASPAATFSR
jgi:hypothetical protein